MWCSCGDKAREKDTNNKDSPLKFSKPKLLKRTKCIFWGRFNLCVATGERQNFDCCIDFKFVPMCKKLCQFKIKIKVSLGGKNHQ